MVYNLKNKSMILVTLLISLFAVLLFIIEYKNSQYYLEHHDKNANRLTHHIINTTIENTRNHFLTEINKILMNADVLSAFENRDREKLLKLVSPWYHELKMEESGFEVMHFILADNNSFVRIHRPDLPDKNVEDYKPLVVKTNDSKMMMTGFESGKLGYYLRFLLPVFNEKRHLGLVEIGINIDVIIKTLHEITKMDVALFADKNALGKHHIENYKNYYQEYAMLSSTNKDSILKNINHSEFDINNDHVVLKSDNIYTKTHNYELHDFKGKSKFVLFEDISSIRLAHKEGLQNLIIITLIVLVLILIILDFSFGFLAKEVEAKQKHIDTLNADLEKKIIEEIEKRKQKEQELLQNSRLAAIGETIFNISHHWRQPLTVLGIKIQDFKEAYEFNELNKQYIEKNVQESMKIINSMSNTITEFNKFFVSKDDEISKFKTEPIIKNIVRMLRPGLKEKSITFDMKTIHDKAINGYEKEYSKAILNIVINAQEALEKSKQTNKKIFIQLGEENSSNYVLKICDNAGGINENIINKIFEPYTSTKHAREGIGVSLYMSKNIIEKQMGGMIYAENSKDGAVFTITFDQEYIV